MEIKIRTGETNWDNLELPNAVYKYREWTNQYHRRILQNREVYMAPPLSFEDPMDCKNPIRYDLLTKEQIYEKYYNASIRKNPLFTEAQHHEFAKVWSAKSAINDRRWLRQVQEMDFLKYNDREGILSLTAEPLNASMWEKYSDNHRGFCVGFIPKIMFRFLGGGCPVEYVDELPIIMPYPWDSRELQLYKQVFMKEKKWSFEKEYRTTKFEEYPHTDDTRKVQLPIEAYSEVIFGKDCPEQHRDEILSIVQHSMPHVKLLETYLDAESLLQVRPC